MLEKKEYNVIDTGFRFIAASIDRVAEGIENLFLERMPTLYSEFASQLLYLKAMFGAEKSAESELFKSVSRPKKLSKVSFCDLEDTKLFTREFHILYENCRTRCPV